MRKADHGEMNRIKSGIRKHLGLVLVGAATCLVLGVVLLLALTGAGDTGHAATVSPSTTTVPGAAGVGAAGSGAKGKRPAVRGAVTAISGDTWSVTVKGVAITVTVTPQTKYGTKAAPLAATDFAVGNEVTIVGGADRNDRRRHADRPRPDLRRRGQIHDSALHPGRRVRDRGVAVRAT